MTHNCKSRPKIKDVMIRLDAIITKEEETGEQTIAVLTGGHN